MAGKLDILCYLPGNEYDFLFMEGFFDLIEEYETEGIIKKHGDVKNFDQFEWIQRKN
jgi:hypothetical protein